MFGAYKVTCVTPAGRKRYLEVLIPQVLRAAVVDEYQLWMNTVNVIDTDYLRQVEAADSRVRIVEPTVLPPGKTASIRQFYRQCTDTETIYIRFDDDIVFIEPGFFEKLLDFRVQHPQYFLISPGVVNNAICTYALIESGRLNAGGRVHPWCMDVNGWANPRFAEQLHRAFLTSLRRGAIAKWHFEPRLIAYSRYSVNCISWFGREFAKFDGVVPTDEEEYLSVTKPAELMLANCIYGGALVAHFAFIPQRAHMDSTDILQLYAEAVTRPTPEPSELSSQPPINLWAPRLAETLQRIGSAELEDLRSAVFLSDLIRQAGLVFDRRFPYGGDNRYMNTERTGLRHMPMQLARCLVQLSEYSIARVLDAVPGNGWRPAVIAAYLARFNELADVIAVGARVIDGSDGDLPGLNLVEYRQQLTVQDLRSAPSDLVILGGDESYERCSAVYEASGVDSSICWFDGINDSSAMMHPARNGGVVRLWQQVRTSESEVRNYEFLDHEDSEPVMGIGLLVRSHARARDYRTSREKLSGGVS